MPARFRSMRAWLAEPGELRALAVVLVHMRTITLDGYHAERAGDAPLLLAEAMHYGQHALELLVRSRVHPDTVTAMLQRRVIDWGVRVAAERRARQ